jgi:hypothetical protein
VRFFLIPTLILLSGCATANIPFLKSGKAEDYNALTYGDDYNHNQNRQGRWGRVRAEIPGAIPPDVQRAARTPASGAPSYYEAEALDASEDMVRQKIESKRGEARAAYVRGDRATRADFYDNAPSDGSLWANENDGNYFFTKGKVHAVGDIVSVKLEPAMIKQFAEEIKKSLSPAEQEVEMALYLKNTEGARNDQDLKAYRNVASEDLRSSEAEEVKTRMEKAVRWSQVDLAGVIGLAPSEEMRAEIVDRYQNGNFKIKAMKRVLYRGSSKMISFIAVAPAADFDEKDVITSGKLYEHKVRVVQ